MLRTLGWYHVPTVDHVLTLATQHAQCGCFWVFSSTHEGETAGPSTKIRSSLTFCKNVSQHTLSGSPRIPGRLNVTLWLGWSLSKMASCCLSYSSAREPICMAQYEVNIIEISSSQCYYFETRFASSFTTSFPSVCRMYTQTLDFCQLII